MKITPNDKIDLVLIRSDSPILRSEIENKTKVPGAKISARLSYLKRKSKVKRMGKLGWVWKDK